jgi:hypothetical protein
MYGFVIWLKKGENSPKAKYVTHTKNVIPLRGLDFIFFTFKAAFFGSFRDYASLFYFNKKHHHSK